mmetsp:Transcript_13496/g.19901  ORF Transcript_13496/g.19901 Transcript_13496/m.19901 type:complete len:528 (+) Transcript_13496:115-1698(+)|eukprot:CAMPEP_0194211924 /NCGR_PEP_ID=MMETSP0156-20130528/11312_1 /TAXON_ID=33649 /ORGANISM="Thalassionema nitzschioides, Strain L26-B" /LENGTH=527 /DNA_ID=CAMNT_0038939613 /DNA_START=72 /DNA_END=1655 /DNA_ORIENTATION=-
MVKKKGKSKRITLKDKYKIQRRVTETGRKRKKQAKRDLKAGIVRHDKTKKDPGIPNSWPFKQELLQEIKRSRDQQQDLAEKKKQKRREELRSLQEHQKQGGSARTVEELIQQASKDQLEFQAKGGGKEETERERKDNTVQAGQASRRAYLRELKKVVDTADVLLQVLDARDPIGSRINSSVENIILSRADKKMVLVLNKIDLVPKTVVSEWLTLLRNSHPTIAIKANKDMTDASANSQEDHESSAAPVGMEGLLQLLKNYARTGGVSDKKSKNKTTIVVGIIGYPNVGKSSIINALKRTRAVGVSPKPGFTTAMQEVVLDRNVRLLDSPGVVFDDNSALLGNCINADSMDDPIPAVEALLKRCNPASLVMTYKIPAFPPDNVMMFLALVARSYGRVLKGGIPDKVGAARSVLRDWNAGKIPYYTPPPVLPKKIAENAAIVSSFGTEFDVNKFDEQVLSSLKESDEMDFVQIEGDAEQLSSQKSNNVFDEIESDEDNDAMDEDDEDTKADHVSRRELQDAEDYDFDEL